MRLKGNFMDKQIEGTSGKLTCNKTILYSIVSLATKEISGVVGLSKKSQSHTFVALQKPDVEGIKIQYNTAGQLLIDVWIDVFSNISAPDLCFKVQENIRSSIFSMVGVKAEQVNVHIVEVVVREEGEVNNEGEF